MKKGSVFEEKEPWLFGVSAHSGLTRYGFFAGAFVSWFGVAGAGAGVNGTTGAFEPALEGAFVGAGAGAFGNA